MAAVERGLRRVEAHQHRLFMLEDRSLDQRHDLANGCPGRNNFKIDRGSDGLLPIVHQQRHGVPADRQHYACNCAAGQRLRLPVGIPEEFQRVIVCIRRARGIEHDPRIDVIG